MSIDLNRAREIFVAAVGKAPAEQAGLIAVSCGDDAALRNHVENLLRADASAGSFLDQPAAAGIDSTIDQAPAECPGTMIGPYKLVELIGEGGMGAVYLAQQTEPVKRLVALKVIKAGMDSRQVLARFEAERQALALMDHPNIARVLDAGTTGRPGFQSGQPGPFEKPSYDAGRPYFVMELVKGVPITKFCDERKLTPRERLELFLPVCHAIQHAHQKGIIHRDIKPTNVLVALYDGTPVPKVIDFGVAKAAGQPLTEKTLVTGLGALVGTPEYMSPEQAELNQLDIDTRSDIYSLGILLYELLTGTTPLMRKRLKDSALLEVLRVIREEEPQKPSTRVSTADELPSIAANRGTEPARLSRLMKGELDWVVMKALEKDRSRRYETANGFALDIQRYLVGEAVLAVPPSVGYRLRKLIGRNQRALVSIAILGGMLILLLGGLTWVVSDRAARQARAAVEVNQFLQVAESLYAANKLPEAVAEVQKARGVLAAGGDKDLHWRVRQWLTDLETAAQLEEILMEFAEPAARKRLYPTIPDPAVRHGAAAGYARVFRDYGIDVEALSTEEAAARIADSHIKLDLVLALDRWAKSARSDPRGLDAAYWQRLQAISRAADPDPWRLRYNAASEATDLRALRELADGADPGRLRTPVLAALGDSLRAAGDVEASVNFLRNVQRRYPADYSINASLGWSLDSLNPPKSDEAIAYRRILVAVRPRSSTANWYLGRSLHYQQGKLDEARAYYKTTIDLDPGHAAAHYSLAYVLRAQGKPEEALVYLRKASDLLPDDPSPLNGLAWELATCAEPKLRNPSQAVTLAKKVVGLSIKQGDDRDHPVRHGNYWNTLGVAHYRAGQLNEAVDALQKSLDLGRGGDQRYLCVDWYFLAMANWKLDRKDEARKWYDRAMEWTVKKGPKDDTLRRYRAEAEELLELSKM